MFALKAPFTHIWCVVGIIWITENCRSKLKACRSCLCKIRARACINGKKFLNSILFRDSIFPRWCKWSFHLQRNACSMEDASGIQNPICNIVLEMAMAVFSESPIIDGARLSGARGYSIRVVDACRISIPLVGKTQKGRPRTKVWRIGKIHPVLKR